VTTWASHADDEAIAHWIGNEQEYDWFCAGLVKESSGSRSAATDDDIRPQGNKLLCCSSQHAKIASCPAFVNLHATPGSEAELLKPVAERSHLSLCFGVGLKIWNEYTNP